VGFDGTRNEKLLLVLHEIVEEDKDFFHYIKLSIPTFVELYPFGTIKSFKKDNVRFQTLFENAPWLVTLLFVRITQHS
jgi:hypothetical protein